MEPLKVSKYSLAQWRRDYMAPGVVDDSTPRRASASGFALSLVAILVWLVVMAIEYLLLAGNGASRRIIIESAWALTVVPIANIVLQFVLLFRYASARVSAPQLISMLLAVPWMAFVIMELGNLRALLASAEIAAGP